MSELTDLYPEGRTFYYEGDDGEDADFISKVEAKGLAVTVTVHVPADKLDWFYSQDGALSDQCGT